MDGIRQRTLDGAGYDAERGCDGRARHLPPGAPIRTPPGGTDVGGIGPCRLGSLSAADAAFVRVPTSFVAAQPPAGRDAALPSSGSPLGPLDAQERIADRVRDAGRPA